MKKIDYIATIGFYLCNVILFIFYLFPGSILGYFLYNNLYIQPQITKDFIISSNHLYIFILLSALGIIAYQGTRKINIVIIYLSLLSIVLELAHIVIPIRVFEWADLFGNIAGVIFVIIIYKIKSKYV